MAAFVLIAHLPTGERRVGLDGEAWLIGASEDCDLRLADPTVSRRHARLTRAEVRWTIEDLGSSNGTRINGTVIKGPASVAPGDALQFGSLACTLAEADADEAELAVPPQSWTGQTVTVRDAISPTTVSSDRLTRFFTEILPQLAVSLGGPGLPPDRAAGALADVLGGVWTVTRDGAVLASSAAPADASQPARSFERDGWVLAWSREDGLDPGNFERVAAPVLALLRSRPEAERPSSTAARTQAAPPLPEPVTRHDGLLNLYRQAAKVAGAGLNVLIEGESGTGKELFARYLHATGQAGQPLVTLNCASLPQDLLDAELFGIERGVATGVDARPGKFEQADGGVIFLDEIGDMHAATQAKLLRVLQEREVYRVGGSKPRPARIQVVSATNRNLETMVEQGELPARPVPPHCRLDRSAAEPRGSRRGRGQSGRAFPAPGVR
jgi:hypothetical protein